MKRTRLVVAVAAVAVLAVVAAFVVGRSPSRQRDGEREAEGERPAMSEALEKHPSLASHRLPLAFVAEKLEQDGGEASGEIVNGPAQELYDDQALPHRWIGEAQRRAADRAFTRSRGRSHTTVGRRALRSSLGSRTVRSWQSLGPDGGRQAAETTYTGRATTVSGRTTSMAVSPSCRVSACTLYVGTAGGGLWRTTHPFDTPAHWQSIGSSIPSQAIGSVYVAPDGSLYVGTGEPNGSSDSEAGVGLYRSTDAGRTFHRIPTRIGKVDFTRNRGIGSVAVDPNHPNHVLVGTAVARHGSSAVNGGRYTPPGTAAVGLYETNDGGSTWKLALSKPGDVVVPSTPTGSDYFRGGVSKILWDPTRAHVAYASLFDYGLFRRAKDGSWTQIYTINTPGAASTSLTSRVEFATAALPNGRTRIYLGDATYYQDSVAGLLRTDDATAAVPSWTELSSSVPSSPGYGSYNFCQGQCSYDMAVTSPPGQPDMVLLSGSMNYDELQAFGGPGDSNGRAVVRSTDAGVSFTDMTDDAANPAHGLHPDQHALVFAPRSHGSVFFTGSDGGVVRQSGPYVDDSAECASRGLTGLELSRCEEYLSAVPTLNQQLNTGLDTLQFQSMTTRGSVLQGGTQDNGTWESDTSSGWAETVGGDGGQSGFDPASTDIRYHSYYSPQHDVSFDGGSPTGWDWISDPLLDSGEAASFYTPFTADPRVPGTIFDGLQHVWRSQDNGGDRAFLDQYCNELTGDYGHRPSPCGDWVALGGAAGDLSGGNTANYVVAIERAAQDDDTMLAATRLGDVYLSTNASAADPATVAYTRIDEALGLPNRFVSGIVIDPAHRYHAWITFSGYSAYSPGGHVYDVHWNPATGTGTAKDISYDLGDQPVTDVAYAPGTGALYVGTDFGVLTRAPGTRTWVATPGLPKVAVYGLTLNRAGTALYAATHGRGIWKLPVG